MVVRVTSHRQPPVNFVEWDRPAPSLQAHWKEGLFTITYDPAKNDSPDSPIRSVMKVRTDSTKIPWVEIPIVVKPKDPQSPEEVEEWIKSLSG